MKHKKRVLKIALAIIFVFYCLFIYRDMHHTSGFFPTYILKYISILFCFFITLMIGKDSIHKRDRTLLQFGMLCTVFADFFFLILNHYIVGIGFFCLVQIIYYFRYKGRIIPSILFRFLLGFLLIIGIHLLLNLLEVKVEWILTMASFYALCIITSVIESIHVLKVNGYPAINRWLIVLGMVLFLLCDINVALSYLMKSYAIELYGTSATLIWIFYLPSQVFLSLSGYPLNRIK